MAHPVTWRTSSYTEKQDCVEVARLADGIAVRDSKFPERGVLVFGLEAFSGLVEKIKEE